MRRKGTPSHGRRSVAKKCVCVCVYVCVCDVCGMHVPLCMCVSVCMQIAMLCVHACASMYVCVCV